MPKTDSHCEHYQTPAFLFFRVVSQEFKIEPKAMLITSGCGVLVNILMGATLHQHGHRCVLLTFEVDYCHLPLNLATNMIPRDAHLYLNCSATGTLTLSLSFFMTTKNFSATGDIDFIFIFHIELLSHGGGTSSSHGHSHGDIEQGATPKKHSQ